jgi:Leucine-rich repeat (LRR) protein
MKLFFKKAMLAVVLQLFFLSCISSPPPDEPFPPVSEQRIITEILQQNNVSVSNYIREDLIIHHNDWPYEYEETGYQILIDDTSIHKLVLTETINQLNDSRLFLGISVSYGNALFIDSIEIKTDSVIILPGLDISQCNLTHLPPEIGKIRTQSLDVSYNSLKDLPLEVMSVFNHLESGEGLISIMGNPIDKSYWDSLPDTMQTWLREHFPE